MADPKETRQEQEARWTTQRTARDQEQQALQATWRRRTVRTWVIVGVIVLIVAGVAALILL